MQHFCVAMRCAAFERPAFKEIEDSLAKRDSMTPTLRSHTLQSFASLRTGTRVEKINSTHGDSHVNGAHGTISTSLGPEMWHGQMTQGYLVTWDDCKAAAFVVGGRIRKVEKG